MSWKESLNVNKSTPFKNKDQLFDTVYFINDVKPLINRKYSLLKNANKLYAFTIVKSSQHYSCLISGSAISPKYSTRLTPVFVSVSLTLSIYSRPVYNKAIEGRMSLPEKMNLIGSCMLNQNEFLNFMETEEEVKIEYHDNGNKMSEEYFKCGVRNGVSTYWYDDGIKKSEQQYKDGEMHGVSTQWFANGQKESEYHHQYGDPVGVWKEWHEDGSKKYEESYKNGKLHGIASGWYDKSRGEKKNYEDRYKDGKLIRTVYF